MSRGLFGFTFTIARMVGTPVRICYPTWGCGLTDSAICAHQTEKASSPRIAATTVCTRTTEALRRTSAVPLSKSALASEVNAGSGIRAGHRGS